ncbi:MAG: hypothetical protein M3N13_01795 [Candidatus Eremiobacteraeota bacterium]|nr:hypothetical protein [Candidatus Eremiobacteraeota bacterium]
MKILTVLALAVTTLLVSPPPARAEMNMAVADAQLAHQVRLGGLDWRVDKIESVAKGDARAAAVKTQIDQESTGYLMLSVSMQNPSASDSRSVPGLRFGFELTDGSQIDEGGASGEYIVPSFAAIPGQLHPKQRINVMYVISGWSGSAPTKMFVKVNSADDSNQSGRGYLRFQLAPGSVAILAPQS